MNNPKKENGYIAIANEIAEQLAKYRLSGQEYQVLWVIFRKTYGWNKKEDDIAISQMEKLTGMKRSNIVRALNKLVSKKILVKTKHSKFKTNTYKFNKYYDSWGASIKKDTSYKPSIKKDTLTVSKKIPKRVSKKIHTKDNKPLYKRQEQSKALQDKKFTSLGADIIKLFESINPSCKRFYANTTQRQACEDLIEEYGFNRVSIIINKTLPKTNTLAFFPSITTPLQLRDKWSSLESAILKHKNKNESKGKQIIGL